MDAITPKSAPNSLLSPFGLECELLALGFSGDELFCRIPSGDERNGTDRGGRMESEGRSGGVSVRRVSNQTLISMQIFP